MNGIPHYLLLTAVLASILGRKRAWIAVPLGLLAWVPFQPHFIGILRGSLGDLSIGSLILTALLAIRVLRGTPVLAHPGIKPTAIVLSLVGILLYGNFFGLIPLRGAAIYESAYFSPATVLGWCAFAAIASWKGWLWPALWVILSLGIWMLKLHPSQNPWDVLLDPVVVLFSIAVTIHQLIPRNHDPNH